MGKSKALPKEAPKDPVGQSLWAQQQAMQAQMAALKKAHERLLARQRQLDFEVEELRRTVAALELPGKGEDKP